MKLPLLARLLSIGLLVFYQLTLPGVGRAQDRYAPRPILVAGDTWTYKVLSDSRTFGSREEMLVRTVSFAGDAAILGTSVRIINGKAGEEEDWTMTPELNIVASTIRITGSVNKVTLTPHRGTFHFPLRVGDQYESSYRLVTTNQDKTKIEIVVARTSKVLGWETISVPAGTFSTLVVESHGVTSSAKKDSPTSTVSEKHWYSPDVRHWVKSVIQNKNSAFELQLTSFKLKEE